MRSVVLSGAAIWVWLGLFSAMGAIAEERGPTEYSGCDADGVPSSCSMFELSDGATMSFGDFEITGATTTINSGSNDGVPFPDHGQVTSVLFDSGGGGFLWLLLENEQHIVDSDPGGNSYSNIEYNVDLEIPAGETLYWMNYQLLGASANVGHLKLTSWIWFDGQGPTIEIDQVFAGAVAEQTMYVFDPPLEGGVSGRTVPIRLYLAALRGSTCDSMSPCAGGFSSLSTQLFPFPSPSVFSDGFESGDVSGWE